MPHDRFEQLLRDGALFFSNAARMTDQFEVSVPQSTIKAKQRELEVAGYTGTELHRNLWTYFWANSPQKENVFVSCWSVRPHESYALWKIYLRGRTEGVAIRTSVSGLQRAILRGGGEEAERFYISKVQYDKPIMPSELNRLSIISTKKPFYDFEDELRTSILREDLNSNPGRMDRLKEGCPVSVNLQALIQYVYICPFAKPGYRQDIEELVKPHGFNSGRVRLSEIRETDA